ncbi:MAG: hypothetical protein IKJ01_02750 [Lachnospiraceae bacterium]|nr:hypothetical protein [Lachnospiraceae bacterium]
MEDNYHFINKILLIYLSVLHYILFFNVRWTNTKIDKIEEVGVYKVDEWIEEYGIGIIMLMVGGGVILMLQQLFLLV